MKVLGVARILVVTCVLLFAVQNSLLAQPVPEYLGVYAVAEGKLIELKPLGNSAFRDMAGVGADGLHGSSGVAVNDPSVYFVIYVQGAAGMTSLFLEEMKQFRYIAPESFSGTPLTPIEGDTWVATKRGYALRVAPMKANPEMMVRAVTSQPIPPGRYGLNIGSALYDIQIGQLPESCVVREGSVFQGGDFRYTDCTEFFAKNPGVRRVPPSGKSASTQPAESANRDAVANRDGTLQLAGAGLTWASTDNGQKADWEGANAYCEDLNLGGFDDWRLPTLEEVTAIYVEAPGGSSAKNFGSTSIGAKLSTCCIWTSTPDDESRRQFFSFASGTPGRIMIKALDVRLMRALCVRDAT